MKEHKQNRLLGGAGAVVLLFTLFVHSNAAISMTLGKVAVPVASQSVTDRNAAVDVGFRKVLVRMIGSRQALLDERLTDMLAQPGRYLNRYSYGSVEQPDGDTKSESLPWVLDLEFDERAVRKQLIDRDVALWAGRREPVLVWLAVDSDGARMLVGADEFADIRAELQKAAASRGLELRFPLLDLEDMRAVQYTTISGGFMETIREASARYSLRDVLVGQIRGGEQREWSARWTLLSEDNTSEWREFGNVLPQVMMESIEIAADNLGERYRIQFSGSLAQETLIEVREVGDYSEYVRVDQFLSEQVGVKNLGVRSIDGDRVRYAVELQGDPERLLGLLGRSDALMKIDVDKTGGLATAFQQDNTPVYYFQLIK